MLGDGFIKNNRRPVGSTELRVQEERERMVKRQLIDRGIADLQILSAFRKVPRHLFVPRALEDQAYEDHPVGIGHQQTISQPYIVAYMLEQLHLTRNDVVLEVGTGSGYQTALLCELAKEVFSVEIVKELYKTAKERLNLLGYSNVYLSYGDGRKGWRDQRSFDKIIVAAASAEIPEPLIQQLKENGFIIIPLGGEDQELVSGQKVCGVLIKKKLVPVRFVPLTKSR